MNQRNYIIKALQTLGAGASASQKEKHPSLTSHWMQQEVTSPFRPDDSYLALHQAEAICQSQPHLRTPVPTPVLALLEDAHKRLEQSVVETKKWLAENEKMRKLEQEQWL